MIALDPATGLLRVPVASNATLAQNDFNAWLRTLDGSPTAAQATITFSAGLDAMSVKPEGVRVLDITSELARFRSRTSR